MARKFKNKNLPRGILIDRGYVFIRIFHDGRPFQECFGPVNHPGVIDDAVIKLNRYREQIRLGKFDLQEPEHRILVEAAADVFWDLHASTKKSAKTFFKGCLGPFKRYFKARYIDDITPTDLKKYKIHRLTGSPPLFKGISPSAFNKERTVLITFFNKLREWKGDGTIRSIKLPGDNPAKSLSRYDEKLSARRRVLAPSEFSKLMEASDYGLKRILTLAVHTMLRRKDLQNLSMNNYDHATNELRGVQAKTGKEYRIPVNSVVMDVLLEGPLDFTNFRKRFDTAVEDAGLGNFQFKDLRRTGARTMLANGHDIKTVSEHLGHASINMTAIYVPPVQKERQAAADTLAESYNDILNCRKNCRNEDSASSEKIKNVSTNKSLGSVAQR